MKFNTEKLIGHILAIITIIVWGTTFIASKILLVEFTPVQVMIMRFIIAYITLLVLNHKFPKTSLRDELVFLSLAVTGTTLYFLLENKALTITNTSNVSIILSAAPILTAILAHFFTKDEKIKVKTIFGAVIAFSGVVLVVFNGAFVLKLNPLGDILSFGAAFSWACYSLILKKHLTKYNPVYMTRKVVFYAILTTLPLLLMENKIFPVEALNTPSFMFCLLFLGVLGSGICYVTWNMATRKLGIVTTNNYIYLGPFITMVAGGMILNEHITIVGILGALLIISGVVVAGMENAESVESIQEAEGFEQP
jgi:drug/metabolite transporter (DMT)-like permease